MFTFIPGLDLPVPDLTGISVAGVVCSLTEMIAAIFLALSACKYKPRKGTGVKKLAHAFNEG